MGCVQIINIAKAPNLPYHRQKHPMADAPYIGPRAGMITCTCPKSLSDIRYALDYDVYNNQCLQIEIFFLTCANTSFVTYLTYSNIIVANMHDRKW